MDVFSFVIIALLMSVIFNTAFSDRHTNCKFYRKFFKEHLLVQANLARAVAVGINVSKVYMFLEPDEFADAVDKLFTTIRYKVVTTPVGEWPAVTSKVAQNLFSSTADFLRLADQFVEMERDELGAYLTTAVEQREDL